MNKPNSNKSKSEISMNFFIRLIFTVISGFFAGAAFYPSHFFGKILGIDIDLGCMGFIAPIFFIIAVIFTRKIWSAVLLGIVFGFVYYLNVMTWIAGVTVVGLLATGVIYALTFWILLGAMIFMFAKHLGWGAPLMIASGWVGYEYLLSWFWGRTPWAFMGYTSMWDDPLMQFADVFGIWGISFVMIFFCATIACSIRAFCMYKNVSSDLSMKKAKVWRRMLIASVLTLVIAHVYGLVRVWTLPEPEGDTITVALTQPSIPQGMRSDKSEKESFSDVIDDRQISIYKALAETPEKPGIYEYYSPDLDDYESDIAMTDKVTIIRKTDNPIELVVDSEMSFIYELEPFILKDKNYGYYSRVSKYVAEARKQGWYMQISAIEKPLKELNPDFPKELVSGRNCSHLLSPEGKILQTFQKIELVPFGEFVPFIEHTLLMYQPLYNAVGRAQHFEAGTEFVTFEIQKNNENIVKYGVVICFETNFPYVNREIAKQGAEFMVVHSNDGWFLDTYAPEQIWTQTRVRAIENRIGYLRAVNSGITGVCDQTGKMVATFEKDGKTRGIAGALVVEAPKGCGRSLYHFFGDILAHICTLLSLALFLVLNIYCIVKR